MTTSVGSVDVDLSRAAELGDSILAALGELREQDPVHWSDASRCWLVTRHADVVDAFAGKFPLSSHQFPGALNSFVSPADQEKYIPVTLRYCVHFSTNQDAPNHQRLRVLLLKAFGKNTVEGLRPFIRERVESLLQRMASAGTVEFNEEIARQLPGAVILRLLGLPESIHEQLKAWADAVLLALGSNQPRLEWLIDLERRVIEMVQVFEAAIEQRRVAPQPDLITALLNASEGESKLTHDELIGTLILIIIAGHESTTSSLTLGFAALARHPDQWHLLRARPELALNAANELMRYSAMIAAQPRLVAQDFTWHGKQLKRGDIVMLMVAGANRDPRVCVDPEVLDITRANAQVVTFGPGLHHCVGHLLAKIQISEFVAALVQRFDGARILDERLGFNPQIVFRGLTHLNVELLPRATS